ncbi:hypothetical protein HY251_21945 [bacterium]|nr:hypothetical protein [bacterium]
MTDDEFLRAFETCALARADWTHRAHVRMAWLRLTRLPFDEALLRIREGIRKLNTEVLKSAGYHETVTVAFTRIIHERIGSEGAAIPFETFASRHADLLDRECKVLLKYYSRELIHSPRAKESFVEPDVSPLPQPREMVSSRGTMGGGRVPTHCPEHAEPRGQEMVSSNTPH